MEEKARIEQAIEVHVRWILLLRTAIRSGTSELRPELVKTDSNCELGQWLYSGFPARLKPMFQEIGDLHAAFHVMASRILELALAGKHDEAERAMEPGSEFAKQSLRLIGKLRALEEVA